MPVSASTAVPVKFINKYETVSPFVPVQVSSGTAPYVYAISPTLPTGMTLDTSTGSISGTPAQRIDPTVYTVTITDAVNDTASSTFLLETNVSYLNAIDLVTNSTLTIQTVESLPISDRLLGDVDITEITVITNDQSGDNIETDGEILLTLPVTQESFKGSLKNYYGSMSVNIGTHTIDQQTYTTFVENTGPKISQQIDVENYSTQTLTGTTNLRVGKPSLSGMRIQAGYQTILVYDVNRELMLTNTDPSRVADYTDPGKFQQIQEVTDANDPRLLTVRVPNFIIGVTGEETQASTGGPPQIWY